MGVLKCKFYAEERQIWGRRIRTTEDLIEVHRKDVDRYELAHKPSQNAKTTKKYTVYNSQKTGGSY
jgi:hypothetical protein